MSNKRYETFEEFWPYYVREHSKRSTRLMHFIGTTAAVSCALGFAVTRKPWLLAIAPIAGYGPAWVSHFFIEKNRPATFTYPLWSIQADFIMWSKIVAGTMDDEVLAAFQKQQAEDDAASAGERRQDGGGDDTHHGSNGSANGSSTTWTGPSSGQTA